MKKLLGIVVLCLLWCNAGNAGNAGPADINEPGQDEKCAEKSIKKIFKKRMNLPRLHSTSLAIPTLHHNKPVIKIKNIFFIV